MQGDNKAVQYRTAHLQWLLDNNNAFALNSADEWQLDLRRWTPSSSARYPIRLKEPKPLTDPEAGELSMFFLKREILKLQFLDRIGIEEL